MTEAILFGDVEQMQIDWLAATLPNYGYTGIKVSSQVDKANPSVRVLGTGGQRRNLVVDTPTLVWEAWHKTETGSIAAGSDDAGADRHTPGPDRRRNVHLLRRPRHSSELPGPGVIPRPLHVLRVSLDPGIRPAVTSSTSPSRGHCTTAWKGQTIMANTAANVIVGKPAVTGGILTGDTASVTLPTDAVTGLDTDLLPTGYISSDGLTQAIGADTNEIKAWGGDIVRRVQTSHDVTYQFTMIETNGVTLGTYYGDANVSGANVQIKAGDSPIKVFVFEVADGNKKVRVVVPNGQVTDRGDVVFNNEDSVGYNVTVTAYPDANGVKAYLYSSGIPASANVAPTLVSTDTATALAAGGGQVLLSGSNFTGVTAVKFGTTSSASFKVVNDNKIVADIPAHTAGSAPITVVNSTGTSNALAFTYS
jgi:hypothetical protein